MQQGHMWCCAVSGDSLVHCLYRNLLVSALIFFNRLHYTWPVNFQIFENIVPAFILTVMLLLFLDSPSVAAHTDPKFVSHYSEKPIKLFYLAHLKKHTSVHDYYYYYYIFQPWYTFLYIYIGNVSMQG